MTLLVHIAPAKIEPKIRRSGLRAGDPLMAWRPGDALYAFPVLESYTHTHQWTREILKWRRQPLIGVYFRIPDGERVLFGHYLKTPVQSTAAAAVGAIRAAEDSRGFQIVLRERVKPDAIVRISPLRGVTGWRHMPDAHARRPCGCPACMWRGEPGRRKLRAKYEAG